MPVYLERCETVNKGLYMHSLFIIRERMVNFRLNNANLCKIIVIAA